MTPPRHDRPGGDHASREPSPPPGADRDAGPEPLHEGGESGERGDSRADDDDLVSPFPHPPWTVGLVLVAGGITLLFGILVSPVWLVVGSPFLLALVLWLYVRLFVR